MAATSIALAIIVSATWGLVSLLNDDDAQAVPAATTPPETATVPASARAPATPEASPSPTATATAAPPTPTPGVAVEQLAAAPGTLVDFVVTNAGTAAAITATGQLLFATSPTDPLESTEEIEDATAIALVGDRIASGHEDGRVVLWSSSGERIGEVPVPFGDAGVTAIGGAPDGSSMWVAIRLSHMARITIEDGSLRANEAELFDDFVGTVIDIAIAKDGSTVAAATDGDVFEFDLEGRIVEYLGAEDVRDLTISGGRVHALASDGTVHAWTLGDRQSEAQPAFSNTLTRAEALLVVDGQVVVAGATSTEGVVCHPSVDCTPVATTAVTAAVHHDGEIVAATDRSQVFRVILPGRGAST